MTIQFRTFLLDIKDPNSLVAKLPSEIIKEIYKYTLNEITDDFYAKFNQCVVVQFVILITSWIMFFVEIV